MKRRVNDRNRIRTFADLLKAFLRNRELKGRAPKMLSSYKDNAGEFAERCDQHKIRPHEIHENDVDEFLLIEKNRGLAPRSVHARARSIKAMLNFALQREIIERKIDITMPKIPEEEVIYPRRDEIVPFLLDACITNRARNQERDQAIILLMADSGLRRSEVVNLNWGDLSWFEV